MALKNENRGNARFDSLIETFNIQKSFISDINDFTIENIESNKIDWIKFDNRIQKEKDEFEIWFDNTFNKPSSSNTNQIINEFDFEKYKNLKNSKQKEKHKLSKQIFSIEKISGRKIVTILGFKIKLRYK